MAARFEDIAEKYLEPVIRGSKEFMCLCPFCSGASSLQFNIELGLWNCFRCDAKGNAQTLVRRLGGVYTDPAVSTEMLHKTLDRMRIKKKRESESPVRVYDESMLERYKFDDVYWTEIRGFKDETIAAWDLGYDPISDRNTIAYRNPDGELLGVIHRLKGDVFPRYIYPEGFDRKSSLFGSWKITSRKAAIVEGSTDVIALSQSKIPAVAQYGSSITDAQVRLLHRLGIKELVMFYDYDEAGRKAEEKSRESIKGIVLRTVTWDTTKYCWHEKLCGCGEHTWRTIGKCQKKYRCKCGRKHGVDPGSLPHKERKKMYREAVLVGSKRSWPTRKYA